MKYKDSLRFKENIKDVSYTSKRKKRREEKQAPPGENRWGGSYSAWELKERLKEEKRNEKVFKRILLTEKTIPSRKFMFSGTTLMDYWKSKLRGYGR